MWCCLGVGEGCGQVEGSSVTSGGGGCAEVSCINAGDERLGNDAKSEGVSGW